MSTQGNDPSSLSVFFCYASADKKYQDKLNNFLSTLRHQGLEVRYSDCALGSSQETDVNTSLRDPDVILLLISPSFISADSCYHIEMKQALAKFAAEEVKVLPVLLRPTDLEGLPLASLKITPISPQEGVLKPITLWGKVDMALLRVVLDLRELLNTVKRTFIPSPAPVVSGSSLEDQRNHVSLAAREDIVAQLDTLKELNPAAVELLQLCTFLHPDAIPEYLFSENAPDPGPLLRPLARDITAWNRTLADLTNHSFIQHDIIAHVFSMSHLVQSVLRDTMDETEQRLWGERAVRAVNQVFPDAEFEEWPTCQLYLPHALTCFKAIKQWQIDTAEAAHLFNQVGYFFYKKAEFADAQSYYDEAWMICERALETEHPVAAQTLHNLGELARSLDRHAQARLLLERALAIRKRLPESEHVDTAQTLNALGELAQTEGEYAQASNYYEQALAIKQQVLGMEDRYTVSSLSNLAGIYVEMVRYVQAEQCYQQVLAIRRRDLGEEHPSTGQTYLNFAGLLRRLEKYELSEQYYRRALTIYKQSYGAEHTQYAVSLNNFAVLYRELGRYTEAMPMLEQAIAIWKRVLGPESRDIAAGFNNMAKVYSDQGNYKEAEAFYQKSLVIRSRLLQHLGVAQVLHNQGEDAIALGQYARAQALLTRALAIREEKFVIPEHPDIGASVHQLGRLYSLRKDYSQAEPLYWRALLIYLRAFGMQHSAVARVMEDLTLLLQQEQRDAEAKALADFVHAIEAMPFIQWAL